MICNFMIFSESVGSGACLSAGYINKSLQKQCFAGSYHFLTFGSLTIKLKLNSCCIVIW